MSDRMRDRGKIPAGLTDSAAASLASFLAGLIAIWTLDPVGLGVYSLFFSAFLAGTFIPRHFVFVPIEMASVRFDRPQRKALARRSLTVGLGPALAGVLVIGIAVLASVTFADTQLLVQIGITAALATFLSPIQDHVRRLLHLSDKSWQAAVVSVVQLSAVGLIAVLAATPKQVIQIDPGWVPFGSIVVANVLSLAVGLFFALSGNQRIGQVDLSIGTLSKPGRWLLLSALSTKGALLLAAAIISHLAGAEALGYAEAARVVAQPVMVLGIGLADVLSPKMMEAGHFRNRRESSSGKRLYLWIFWAVGLAYLVYASTDWAGNVMAQLIPTAYDIRWLVAVSIVANLVNSSVYPNRLELLGGRQERRMALADTWSAAGSLLMAALSSTLMAFARPLGVGTQGLIQWYAYSRDARTMYGTEPPAQDRQSDDQYATTHGGEDVIRDQ